MRRTNKGKKFCSEKIMLRDEATGREIWQMTNFPAYHNKLYITTASWTPDNRSIVFLGQRSRPIWNLFVMDEETGEITQITDEDRHINPYNPEISSDGKWVWYHTGGEELKAVNVHTFEERVFAKTPGWQWSSSIAETPDRKHLIGRSFKDASVCQPDGMSNFELSGRILIVPMDATTEEERVVTEEHFHFGHVLPPNKDGIIVYAKYDQGELWRVNTDGSEKRKLYGNYHDIWISHPVWLGDSEVLFVEWPRAIKKVNLDGKLETVAQLSAFHPSVSPDQKKVIFDTHNPNSGIYIIDLPTGRSELLCLDRCESIGGGQWAEERPYPVVHHYPWHVPSTHVHPSFNRDGTKILFNSNYNCSHMQLFMARV